MFTKKDRATFKYTFAHWCAFQMTALNLGVWKFKYLFHDIEKPFLKLLWKDYKKVQSWHRKHNKHHMEYKGVWDSEAMVIDWECSRFTKSSAQMTARETYDFFIKDKFKDNGHYLTRLYNEIEPILKKLNL